MGGLRHRAIQFLIDQLDKNSEKNGKLPSLVEKSENDEDSEHCARTKVYPGRKPFDMFGWLASKHRKPQLEKIPS